jgi:aspartate/methionine/tyrosine aminotransferase
VCQKALARRERITETPEFGKAVIRMIRTMSRRVGAADIAELGALFEVLDAADEAVVDGITDLLKSGYSYSELAREIGWTRQRLTQWYERRTRQPDPPAQVTGEDQFSRNETLHPGPGPGQAAESPEAS